MADLQGTLRSFAIPSIQAIVANAGGMVATAVVTSGLGIPYWVLAAHTFPASAVGLGSAAVSAMTLLSFLGMVGLGTLLVSEYPRHPGKEGRLVVTALATAASAGTVLGLLFSVVVPRVFATLGPIGAGPAQIAFFSLSVGVGSAALVLDGAVLGLLLGHLQFIRNALFSVLKLALLWLIVTQLNPTGWLAIMGSWSVANLVASAPVAAYLLIRHHPDQVKPYWRFLEGLHRSALEHHSLNMALLLPSFTLPVLVAGIISPQANAYFYTAWMIAYFVFVGPHALTHVLYTVSVRDRSQAGRYLGFTLRLSLLCGLATIAVMLLAADPVLRLFGPAYAANGRLPLLLITLAVIPMIIKSHFVAISRIEGTVGRAAMIVVGGSILELGAAFTGGRLGGLVGLSLGWLLATAVEGAVIAPLVRRSTRSWGAFSGSGGTMAWLLALRNTGGPER
jgi:O-antigen/teichoic acid export membrane protein